MWNTKQRDLITLERALEVLHTMETDTNIPAIFRRLYSLDNLGLILRWMNLGPK